MTSRKRLSYILPLLLVLWQSCLISSPHPEDRRYSLQAATGLAEDIPHFLFFYYHLNLYPVAATCTPAGDTKEAALQLLKECGKGLYMHRRHRVRFGDPDPGQILLYLPVSYLRGGTQHPEVTPFNAFSYLFSLLVLFIVLLRYRATLLGGVLVLGMGAHTTALYENYQHENLFGWGFTSFNLLLALHIPLILEVPLRRVWIIPVAAGIFLATVGQWRTEPTALLLSCLLAYAACRLLSHSRRLLLSLALFGSFYLMRSLWDYYFELKYREASAAVAQYGGIPFEGPRFPHHPLWHALFLGLSDFGGERAPRSFEDKEAYRYAAPILKERYGIETHSFNDGICYRWEGSPGKRGDAVHHNCSSLELLPMYHNIVRGRVIELISDDPVWYAGVLAERVKRVLSMAAPLRYGALLFSVPFPLILIGVTLLLCMNKRSHLLLIAFVAPLSSTAILVYSGDGMPYLSALHVVCMALLIERIAYLAGRSFKGSGSRVK